MTDLHVHTKYSLLDAIIKPEELIQKIKQQGKIAVCVTDHGNLYANVEMYKLCQDNNIKYLMGCEMYICDCVECKDKSSKYHHLLLICKNETGRLNLNQLVSISCSYKYYGKPRIDWDMLMKYKEGLIVCSACMAGEIQRALLENYETAKEIANKYKSVFGDDYYLEYQAHTESTQQRLNTLVVKLAKELNIKYIVTTDAHYLNPEDQKYHTVFVGIGQTREVGEIYNDCYIQSEDEILHKCQSTSESDNITALRTTDEIAAKCNVQIPLSAPLMPHDCPVPPEYKSEFEYLKALCLQGWYNRGFDKKSASEQLEYKNRLVYELSAIKSMEFEGYFLFVWSYANSVKRRGIARGSAGGSLVSYLMNITDIDPIKYGLYFERFIDVGAIQLLKEGKITKRDLKIPDVDEDFGKKAREVVLQKVINQYGEDHVAALGVFQYIWAKGAIKSIGKVLKIPFEVTNAITKTLDNESIEEAIDYGLLDKYKDEYPELFDYASKLSGLPKSFGSHPCGKVACSQPVVYYNATDISKTGEVVLQGDAHAAEDMGLVKADFLGLRTVDVIYDVLDMINKDYNYIAPDKIDLNDEAVYENFKNGYTDGIFQFESSGMKSVLKKIECSSIEDLIIANALYRPGSIDSIEDYANRKKNIQSFSYLHDDLIPILKNTYGIMVFQEQLIDIGRLAKLNNPDELRKATAKKKQSLLDKIKPKLFDGLSKRNWTQEQMLTLWDTMVKFGKYSFNRSHAAGYSLIAYICMYLKIHHPKEFVCAWINNYHGDIKKINICIEEAKRLGIKIYYSCYGCSYGNTIVYKDGILIGTECIKGCNIYVGESLQEIFNENDYDSFTDVLNAIHKYAISKSQIESLIRLNYFSEFGKNQYLLDIVSLYETYGSCKTIKKSKLNDKLTENLIRRYAEKETPAQFSEIDNIGIITALSIDIPNESISLREQLATEIEYLGYVVSTNTNFDHIAVISDIDINRNNRTTFFDLATGERKSISINSKLFIEHPYKQYDLIQYKTITKQVHGRNGSYEYVQLSDWTILE